MRRVGFIPDPAPLTTAPAGTRQENKPQADAVDAEISTIAEPDAEPTAAEGETDAEPGKKPAGRKSRRKADAD